jgi:hypothetical protein
VLYGGAPRGWGGGHVWGDSGVGAGGSGQVGGGAAVCWGWGDKTRGRD